MAVISLPPRLLVYEFLTYDPEAIRDAFTWNHQDRRHFPTERGCRGWNARFAGKPAGGVGPNGYLYIRIQYVSYLAHRIAWLLVYGEPVPPGLDHANGDRLDNRIGNLRPANQSQNLFNSKKRADNKTGVKGVYFSKTYNKFGADIWVKGKKIFLGYFPTLEEAATVRQLAAALFHGEFARHD